MLNTEDITTKPMNAAIRRHHDERVKKNRRFHWGQDLAMSPTNWQRVVNTPTQCSCWRCGNPRKFYGERTVQELRQLQAPDCSGV